MASGCALDFEAAVHQMASGRLGMENPPVIARSWRLEGSYRLQS